MCKPLILVQCFLCLTILPARGQDLLKIDSLITSLGQQSADTVRTRILYEIAIEFRNSDTLMAIDYLDQGRILAEKAGDTWGLGRYYQLLGQMNAYHGNYRNSILNYDRALAYYSEADDDVSYYGTLKDKGNSYLYLAEYDLALNEYNSALDFYRRNNMEIGISRCLNNMGIIHKNRGEYVEALTVYDESVIYLDSARDAYDICQAYINMGNVFVYLGSYDQAIEHFNKALDIANRHNYKRNLSLTLSNIGVVQNKCTNYHEAHQLYTRALAVSESLNDKIQISNCLINIGTNYADMGQPENGIDYLTKGMEIKIELGDERAISNCYIYLAEIYIMTAAFDRAIELFNTAIPVKEALGDQEGLVRCYLGLGSVFLHKKQYGTAQRMTTKALTLADQIGALEHMVQGSDISREIALALGDFQAAYQFAIKYHKYSDSLLNETTSKAVMEMEFRNRSKVLEQENENLRVQSELNAAFLKKRNAFMYSLLGIAVMLAAGLILVVYFLRRLRTSSLKLEEKNLVITRQNLKLDALNKTKDQMMSIIAHDLRGTIGNQLTAIDVLYRIDGKKQDDLDRNKLLGNLKHSASYSLELLENLLHYSRLKENESHFHPEEVKVASLVANCIALYDETAGAKGISFRLNIDMTLVCKLDRIMMEAIFRNLISNAIKFSNRGGVVDISAELSENIVLFKIKDQGIGLSGEQIQKILHNGGYSRRGTANEKGAGIGLTLVREFTYFHHGSLKIISKPREGSCFEVSIPQHGQY